jgi:parallel beta helix pectate lyase-like protein
MRGLGCRAFILGATGMTALAVTPYKARAAATINAASGLAADIQVAVNAALPGDTVQIPTGTFAFTGQVFAPDGIHIKGAGRDSTYLIKSDNLSAWQGMFTIDCKTGLPFIFSDMTLQGRLDALQGTNRTTAVTNVTDQGLYIKGAAKNVQIYNCRFTKFIRAGVELRGDNGTIPGPQTGVIYNNIFYDNWYTNLGYGVAIDGYPNSWSTTHALGTANAVYIEDNYFELYRHAVTSGNGANYVARYNTCKNNYQNAQTFDAHGKSASWPRGTQTVEIYNNTVNNAIVRWAGVAVRGGSGVVWGNTISGVQHGVVVQLEMSGAV